MVKSRIIQQLNIQLPSHAYPIYIGEDLLLDANLLKQSIVASQVLIVTNDTIAPLYLKRVQRVLAGLRVDVLILQDGEVYKNQSSLFAIYDALINAQHHRDTTLVALGGGVIGDLVGFAASTYHRGVGFIQLPTTLLAQVDASVGGKTAINHPLGKNMIGSFYQPNAVIMDLSTLKSLPSREFNAGLAEVIKYALLVGGDFLSFLMNALQSGIHVESTEVLAELIMQCCRIKAGFVEVDERELGSRALLNLGHTFGHALEAITHYQRWLHGEAVAIGIYCAVLLSYQLGYLHVKDVRLVDSLLASANLPRRIPKMIDLVELQALMMHDKKIKNNQLRFVLMKAFGDCFLDSQVSDENVCQVLLKAVEGDCV